MCHRNGADPFARRLVTNEFEISPRVLPSNLITRRVKLAAKRRTGGRGANIRANVNFAKVDLASVSRSRGSRTARGVVRGR